MTPARLIALAIALVAAEPAAAEPPPDPARPKVVLRISRTFVESLTRRGFEQDEPIATTQMGATIAGSARVAGGYSVVFNKSQTETAFDLRVDGRIDTQLGMTRRPVCVALSGHASLLATRRVAFDGRTYAGGPVGVEDCYQSTLDGIGTLRRGPLAPVVRRIARPVVLRALPDADRAAGDEIRTQVRDAVTRETDQVVAVLNAVHAVREDVTELLKSRGLRVGDGRLALATTDDALLAGLGFPAGAPASVPDAAGGLTAPVEIWVYHPLTAGQELAFKLIHPDVQRAWDERVKPRLVERLARQSPALARRLEEAAHEVTINVLPGWHRIRFFKELHGAAPSAL
ncbi:MAG TPA: hypothetical protein VH092_20890 [Urbifossiella sp.]|nr:hypothetical protein [Urbifossiella sp.]